jgi:site-specific DNA-methyltransferase (adenine-specific)/modification methylase
VTPYYEEAGITIFCGDCREILPQLGRFDLLLTDPPYGINYIHSGNDNDPNGTRSAGIPVHGDDQPFDPEPFMQFKEIILWGGNHYASRLPDSRGWLVWDKRCNTVVNDQSDVELAWTNIGNTARVFYHVWDGFRRQSERNVPRAHPTQKPVALMQWCLNKFSSTGAVVDPFMGSGTTLVAAKNMGREAIGIELEERYAEIAANRLRQSVFNFEEIPA